MPTTEEKPRVQGRVAPEPVGRDWTFKRGLSPGFIARLKKLAQQESWFADVLKDQDLTIGIRDDYINIYADGQSLFKVSWKRKDQALAISTHPKYLVDPSLSEPVPFNGTRFDISSIDPLAEVYEDGRTLERMKKAAENYRGDEKAGVQKIVRENPNIIDLEIALNKDAEQDVLYDAQKPKATAKE